MVNAKTLKRKYHRVRNHSEIKIGKNEPTVPLKMQPSASVHVGGEKNDLLKFKSKHQGGEQNRFK